MMPDVSLLGIKPGETADPKAVAAKVQGMFTEVMLKAMEDSVDAEDGLFGKSATSDIYRGMLREQLAGAISKQMQSPLEGQLDKALDRVGTHPEVRGASQNELPVDGVISSPQGWR